MNFLNSKPPVGTPLNKSHPLQRDLVGFWLMNEGAGSGITDISDNGNNGLLSGIVSGGSSTSGWKGGVTGSSVLFDGVDDVVNITTFEGYPSSTSARSTSFWFKQLRRSNGVNSAMFEVYTSGQGFIVQFAQIGGVVYLFTDAVFGLNNITLSGAEIPTLGVWNHCVFSITESLNYTYYLNGRLAKSGTLGTTYTPTNGATRIGRRNSGVSGYTNGFIDNVRYYKRALNSNDVNLLYNQPYIDFHRPTYRFFSTPPILTRSWGFILG